MIPIMYMFDGEAELYEPIHDLCLGEGHFSLLGDFDFVGEISSGGVLHDDVESLPCGAIDLSKLDDV